MRNQEISQRYARALFELSKENKNVEEVLNQLREINHAFEKDKELKSFFTGPTVGSKTQLEALNGVFATKKFNEVAKGFLTILAQKRRFEFLPDIVTSLQATVDDSHGIARGDVRSASTLLPEERDGLERTISRYTRKKVVLEYHEDQKLVGGLVAKVGSFTFDDTLETQLRLMREAIKKRRAN